MHWKPTYCRNVCGMAGIRRWRCARQMQSRSQTRPEIENRSEEHTSELQSLMRISYAVFCLKKKKTPNSQSFNILNPFSFSTVSYHKCTSQLQYKLTKLTRQSEYTLTLQS